ncbi:MAG TPA: glutathione S-transferase family protein [Stellaceae bacterium]|nr:glutathione S-transferase family protein [Stellaceae bacterium]
MASGNFTLYGIALSGPTYKAALMLSLCGQKFSYRHMNLREGAHKRPEFLAINRYGQVPALVHGELNLCQSGAILQYLADTLGKFAGNSVLERQRAREWLLWDADRLSPGVFRSRAYKRGFMKGEPAVLETFRQLGEAGLTVLDENLARSAFLAGTAPTIGDVACYGVVALAEEGGFDINSYKHIASWAGRIQALPGFKAPYDLLPLADIP